MAPIAVVFLLPATLFMEENVLGITLALAREDTKIVWLLLFTSSLAYFVNSTNFLVTKHTSALSLQETREHVPPEESFEVARKVKEMYCYTCSNIVKEKTFVVDQRIMKLKSALVRIHSKG